MEQALSRIVVVGAGFGGLTFCQQFKHPKARVTLVDRTNHHLTGTTYSEAASGFKPVEQSAR